MSIVALAVRWATVYALRGATLSGLNVFDAPIDPLQDSTGISGPLTAIYCGREHGKPEGRDMLSTDRTLVLTVQSFLPDSVTLPNIGELAIREAGAEFALDLIWRQTEQALLVAETPWALLWRQLVVGIEEFSSLPLLLQADSEKEQVRVAARETALTLSTMAEAPFGIAPSGVWASFITQMQAEPDLAPLAALIASMISTPALVGWRQTQVALGLTEDVAADLGLTPAVNPLTDPVPPNVEPPLLAEIDLTDTAPNQQSETVTVTFGTPEAGIDPGQPPAPPLP